MSRILIHKTINFLVALFIVFPQLIFAGSITSSLDVSVSAQVGYTGNNGSSSGSIINAPTIIKFSGIAHPFSRIYIIKDNNIIANTIADQFANFSTTVSGLKTNIYTFYIYAEDQDGKRSSLFSLPIFITYGTTVNIGNIFLSPTIAVDKYELNKGENLTVYGKSVPQKEVSILINSNEDYIYKTISDAMGNYYYRLNTASFDVGKYYTKSRSSYHDSYNPYSPSVSFFVKMKDKVKNTDGCFSIRKGDLNCDGRVNLVDFSIMAFWYKKINYPMKVDLNNDNEIGLADFSIMMFNWTN